MDYFLRELARDAGKIILEGYGNISSIDVKEHAGLVTDVDKRTEEFIIEKISKRFPGSSILAEESGEMEKGGSMRWLIDPLDGTSNFAHGFPWFCVSIALEINGEVKYGVIYQPVLEELFYCEKGKGAFLNSAPIKVSEMAKIADSLVATGFSYLRDEMLRREVKRFLQVQQIALGVRRAGSAALDFANVACGRFAGFYEYGLSPWDVAAGFLLVKEAGGKISNYEGAEASIYDKYVVASNGLVHDELLGTIKVNGAGL